MKQPLISVSIPTRNSENSLGKCLKALRDQSYKNIEIIIIDKNSTDRTLQIAKKYGAAKIKNCEDSLLAARLEGVKASTGKYSLILDSDQILEKSALKRAIEMVENNGFEMIAFEELVYKQDTFVEKLFACDRALINSVNDLSPFTGVIMPRFFNTKLLKSAYNSIPKKIIPNTGGPDHAIVYYEAWKISKKIGILPKAVYHMEPSSIGEILPKFYRWGYTSAVVRFGKYDNLMNQKERFRTGLFTKGLFVESLGSITLLLFKGVAFKLGLFVAMIDRMFDRTKKI